MSIDEQPLPIIVATVNRKDDLRTTLRSVQKQTVPHEIIVLDDGSTDGTSDMVASEFPDVRLIRSEVTRGVLYQRNLAARIATHPVIVFLDDDVEFPHPQSIEQALTYLDHPRVGVVPIPHIDINLNRTVHKRAPEKEGVHVTETFIGAGCVLRRELFCKLRGFREIYYMHGEEEDLCIRMLEAGYVVRVTRAEPFYHHRSPIREVKRRQVVSRRNQILMLWLNAPRIFLPFGLFKVSVRIVLFSISEGCTRLALQGLFEGFRLIFTHFSERIPVSLATYLIYRKLRKGKFTKLVEFEHNLRPFQSSGS